MSTVDPYRRAFVHAEPPEQVGAGLPPDLLTAIDMLNLGILVVDREGRITFANRAGEDLLQCRAGLSIHNHLRDDIRAGSNALERLRAAISRGERVADRCFALPAAGDKSLTVLIIPSHGNDAGAAGTSSCVLFVSEPTAKRDVDLRPIARLYGLTRAETRLLHALLRGDRVANYAKQAGITLNTAKGYLKQLFSKTHTSRQSDLMRLVLTNPVLLVSSKASVDRWDKGESS